jgi:hypothetical protein
MFPQEAHPYILATGLMAAFFFAAMVRLWFLRRAEAALLKNKSALEKQVLTQQKDLMQVRSDANAWRAEMQRQFDLFRHMASDQLKVEESRFDNLLNKSRAREHELLAELEIARRMCSELPSAKARLLQLESLLGIDSGEGLPALSETTATVITPLPDLNGSPEPAARPSDESTALSEDKSQDSATLSEVAMLRQENQMLKQALNAEKLRNRIRERSHVSLKAKNRRN